MQLFLRFNWENEGTLLPQKFNLWQFFARLLVFGLSRGARARVKERYISMKTSINIHTNVYDTTELILSVNNFQFIYAL